MESEGSSRYNALEASVAKRLSCGLQFLASVTFYKALDTDGADIHSTASGKPRAWRQLISLAVSSLDGQNYGL